MRSPTCETCGATEGVTEIVVHSAGQDRRTHMCATCKAERLERRRVRVAGSRQHARTRTRRAAAPPPPRRRGPALATVPVWLGRLGWALMALGVLVLVVMAAVAGIRALGDDPPPECYPGAGFSCPAEQ